MADPVPARYDLEIIPDVEAGTFHGTVSIQFAAPAPRSCAHLKAADNLTILSVTQNSAALEFERDAPSLWILTDDFASPVLIAFEGAIGNSAGFYQSDRGAYLTQMQMTYAPCALPCCDDPGVRSALRLTLHCPPQFTALGNMAVESQTATDAAMVYVFEPTPPLTATLYAWAFGSFVTRTAQTARGIEIGFHMPVNSDLLEHHAEWLENEVRIVDFLEEWTDFPLQLKKLDVLVARSFIFGGMENYGLIVISEGTMRRRTPGHRRDLLLHETFHHWHGDLVGCARWAHFYLHESFARFCPKFFAKEIFNDDGQIAYWKRLSFKRLLGVDFLPVSPFPVLMDDPPENLDDLVSPIIYDKGGYIIAMIYRAIGPEAFRNVLRKFYKTYAWKSVLHDDLWQLFMEVSDVSRFEPLLKQRGYPLVILEPDGFIRQIPCSPNEADAGIVWGFPLRLWIGEAGELRKEEVWLEREPVQVCATADWVCLDPEQEMLCRVWHRGRWFEALYQQFLVSVIGKEAWDRVIADVQTLWLWGLITELPAGLAESLDLSSEIQPEAAPWGLCSKNGHSIS
jgi:aminopeptidase N